MTNPRKGSFCLGKKPGKADVLQVRLEVSGIGEAVYLDHHVEVVVAVYFEVAIRKLEQFNAVKALDTTGYPGAGLQQVVGFANLLDGGELVTFHGSRKKQN